MWHHGIEQDDIFFIFNIIYSTSSEFLTCTRCSWLRGQRDYKPQRSWQTTPILQEELEKHFWCEGSWWGISNGSVTLELLKAGAPNSFQSKYLYFINKLLFLKTLQVPLQFTYNLYDASTTYVIRALHHNWFTCCYIVKLKLKMITGSLASGLIISNHCTIFGISTNHTTLTSSHVQFRTAHQDTTFKSSHIYRSLKLTVKKRSSLQKNDNVLVLLMWKCVFIWSCPKFFLSVSVSFLACFLHQQKFLRWAVFFLLQGRDRTWVPRAQSKERGPWKVQSAPWWQYGSNRFNKIGGPRVMEDGIASKRTTSSSCNCSVNTPLKLETEVPLSFPFPICLFVCSMKLRLQFINFVTKWMICNLNKN